MFRIGISWVLVVTGLLLATAVGAAAFDNEPEGFRGIKWGGSLFTAKELVLVEREGTVGVYRKRSDKFEIGKAEVNQIVYKFFRDRFYMVEINFQDLVNYNSLRKQLFEIYGDGWPNTSMWRKEWKWYGEEVNIVLQYETVMKEGRITYTYLPIEEEALAEKKEQSRQGQGDL